MNQLLEDLIKVMTLERLEINLFRGQSRDIGSPQVFGGQVLGQALVAATATVENRQVYSLHAYFLRRGDFNSPIVYEVDRAWDGKHFATRRVVAIQYGQQIFNMSASFQMPEPGLDHQFAMPDVPQPEALPDLEQFLAANPNLPPALLKILQQKRPFEFRPVEPPSLMRAPEAPPLKHVWIRAVDTLPDDEALHRCLLAYASDFQLLDTALKPHGLSMVRDKLVIASIDHAMWFHRSVRVDDWLLYAMDSPSASGARGFTRGSVFARDGRLVASVSQEGLIRVLARETGP
ncbi:MAG TPA: acyl-CoA thioesterase II [Steroidobacteraceae bacterium]|nr:acyl-CoA thioesterase II [Steroidobacteraceae bacterium]